MKKIFILCTILISAFAFSNVTTSNASTTVGNITWSTVASHDVIYADLSIPEGTETIIMKFATGGILEEWAVYESGPFVYTWSLRNANDYPVKFLFYEYTQATWDWNDVWLFYPNDHAVTYDFEYSEYYINLPAYDVESTGDTDSRVTSLRITIPIDDSIDSITYADLYDELVTNTIYEYDYETFGYGQISFGISNVRKQLSWTFESVYISNYIEIPPSTNVVDVFIAPNGYLYGTYNEATVKSVYYYNEDKEVIRNYELTTNNLADSVYFPDSEELQIFNIPYAYYNYNITNEVKYIRIEYGTANDHVALLTLRQRSEQTAYYLDHEAIKINWNADGDTYLNLYGVAGTSLVYYINKPVKSGYVFSHWVDQNGETVVNGDILTNDMVTNGVVNIEAIFIRDATVVNTQIDDPTLESGNIQILLDDLGFNDSAERVIVFALVLLLVTIGLIAKRVQMFSILIVDGLIVAFFISLGLIPTFVSIIIVIVLIFLAYTYFMSGGVSNE